MVSGDGAPVALGFLRQGARPVVQFSRGFHPGYVLQMSGRRVISSKRVIILAIRFKATAVLASWKRFSGRGASESLLQR